jgi:hypothetical protein
MCREQTTKSKIKKKGGKYLLFRLFSGVKEGSSKCPCLDCIRYSMPNRNILDQLEYFVGARWWWKSIEMGRRIVVDFKKTKGSDEGMDTISRGVLFVTRLNMRQLYILFFDTTDRKGVKGELRVHANKHATA